jgi:hypothetical protein
MLNIEDNKRKIVLWFPILIIVMAGVAAAADDPQARAIMEKVDARNDGDNQTADMEMVLIDKKGRKRIRRIKTFTAFLTYDYDNPAKDDDQWLYLPALRKTKRIATADKSGSFMGSDLNYSDMTSPDLEDYDFSFYEKGKEADVRGKKVWVIWSIPRTKEVVQETGYKKSLLFVRPDIDMVVRAIRWVKDGGYLKYVDAKKLEQIDGIWVATETQVTKKRGKTAVHKTIMTWDNVNFNQDLDYNLFTIRRMEKGL